MTEKVRNGHQQNEKASKQIMDVVNKDELET